MADPDEIVLPVWQPDHATSNCSICNTPFTFLNRRHHCRRCGRLVCATCSPHRITIPRQYIVRPPEERLWDEDAAYTRPRSNTEASYVDNLGGGETIRVCNPCVPDPNYGPPPQHETPVLPVPPLPPATRSRASTYAHDSRPSTRAEPRDFPSNNESAPDELYQTPSRSAPFRHSFIGYQTALQSPNRPGLQQTNRSLNDTRQRHRLRAATAGTRTRSDDSALPTRQFQPAPPVEGRDPTAQPQKSRVVTQLREEDECPVCGTHEPPFGPDGESAERERHVEECLSNHFAFSAGPSNRPPPGPGASAALPESPVNSSLASTPPAAHSPALRQRMLVYHATEKDSFDESGEPQECVICFEEFQTGDEMGRLECLCRFHRTCIRSWWSTKGPGSCPTHQLHS